VNSTNLADVSANGRSISLARWNSHYLIPKRDSGTSDSIPIDAFAAITPDWVFVAPDPNNLGQEWRKVISAPDQTVIGRYAYAIYDEGGLLDINVAGYPTNTTTTQSGGKGSLAFADLQALGSAPIFNPTPNPGPQPVYQVDKLVGWRNYATTDQSNTNNNDFPYVLPSGKAFARNFRGGSDPAASYYSYVVNNAMGFLSPNPIIASNGLTDQVFLGRKELITFQSTPNTNNGTPIAGSSQFDVNSLQYLTTFSRETNSPSFSPSTPPGSSIDYAALASTATAVNPNFLLRRVTSSFTRFDGTAAVVGEPLVKTRFPFSRLAWITYKGPSALRTLPPQSPVPPTTDPNYDMWALQWTYGISASYLRAGTAANIKASFGLVWDSRTFQPVPSNSSPIGQQWVYTSPSSLNTGGNFDGTNGNPASDIKRLDIVASENREPDFFELLRATILDGSVGENTAVPGTSTTGVTGGNVFPDVHMGNKAHHLLTIGASIIDQADPDSLPTRIQFVPTGATIWWAAYGIESLPYITQIYPIAGTSPVNSNNWATYLLFQLWNPHIGAALLPTAPQVRMRVDGGMGIFTGGNGQTWASATDKQTMLASGQSIALTAGAFPPTGAPTPAPLGASVLPSMPGVGSASAPCGFERLPGSGGNSLTNYVGLRLLPDYTLTPANPGQQFPKLTLFFGTDATHQFNATMEYLVPGSSPAVWVPYNHFIGMNDQTSWINGDTIPVRTASILTGRPASADAFDNNASNRLKDPGPPACLMKADPRSTRFGIFQMDVNLDTANGRISQPLWPTGRPAVPNGYGGPIADPGGPVEHAPLRFVGNPYFPATLCLNAAASTGTRTGYADGDGIIRPADAVYPDPSDTATGSSTPYYATSTDYHPITLNHPLRNVAELGYVFRDLPWKTLDFFTDKSADAGLLDVFTINDGPALLDGSGNFLSMGPVPTMVAGNISLNTGQAAVLQSTLAGAILDEVNTTTVSGTPTPPPPVTSAPVIAANIVTMTSPPTPTPSPTPCPLSNRSELFTRPGLLAYILPVPAAGAAHDQRVKSRREAMVRAISSVSQTRVWNLLIDVIAQSGRYPSNLTQTPNPADLPKFIVEGEQRYWVHVAIDRFTGRVIDKQIEVVNE
jgi:hypothetical protein